MITSTAFDFPDINKSFIGAISLNDVCYNYIRILNDTKIFYNNQYANKLLEFVNIDDKIHLLEDEFREYKEFLRQWEKENGVHVKLKRRKKDFISFNAKIRLFLSESKDLNAIRDLIGIRLILCTDQYDTIETQKLCYKLMNDTLLFFTFKRHCLLLKAEDRLGKPLTPNSDIAKKIFIYDKSELLSEFEDKVKNYVLKPKDIGYQGLHGYVKTPAGLVFEIQIRTVAMDLYDEAIHEKHKLTRYAESKIELNCDAIKLPGIVFNEDHNLVYDIIGLFESIDPF